MLGELYFRREDLSAASCQQQHAAGAARHPRRARRWLGAAAAAAQLAVLVVSGRPWSAQDARAGRAGDEPKRSAAAASPPPPVEPRIREITDAPGEGHEVGRVAGDDRSHCAGGRGAGGRAAAAAEGRPHQSLPEARGRRRPSPGSFARCFWHGSHRPTIAMPGPPSSLPWPRPPTTRSSSGRVNASPSSHFSRCASCLAPRLIAGGTW